MESIFLSKSGVHHRGESVPKWGSTSKVEWREESVQTWSHDLQTSMGPSHRCSRVSRESMFVRHSRVKSAQSDPGSVHPDPSPSSSSFFLLLSILISVQLCLSGFVPVVYTLY